MNLIETIRKLVESSSQEGCDPQLTVVNNEQVEELRELINAIDAYKVAVPGSGTPIMSPIHTIAYSNAFEGLVLEGLFTSHDEAVEAAEQSDDQWLIAPVYPQDGD